MDEPLFSVTSELRAAEAEIDSAYLFNPLTKLSFSEAAWYFLAHCEERVFGHLFRIIQGLEEETFEGWSVLADILISEAKWPLRWLKDACAPGEVIPSVINDTAYSAAMDLSSLASSYSPFEAAYTYASLGLLQLRIENKRIIASDLFRRNTRFEAYDRLEAASKRDFLDPRPLAEKLKRSVRIRNNRFSYGLNPRLVQETLEIFKPVVDERFSLPSDWQMADYTLGEFGQVAKILWVLSLIHFNARIAAAGLGCRDLGYSDSVIVMRGDELRQRIARYSHLDAKRVESILRDMTFGMADQRTPDPALQPLVPLTSTRVGWART